MAASLRSAYRTHTCGELRKENVGERVKLSGWLAKQRDHGALSFLDMRDNYGITQAVVSDEQLVQQVRELRIESVITIEGSVVERSAGANQQLQTGEIEIQVDSFELLSPAGVLPFQIAEDDNSPETTRLQFRFLELRREKLHRNIQMRSRITARVRSLMEQQGFYEVHTPILTSDSPEGARCYLVPSRAHAGKFFALPQAPQIFKQLLMSSGFDRYFQIAPCFRDEDPRADRSPGEFYQIDLEMSFVEQEDVFAANEFLISNLFKDFTTNTCTATPYPRIPYAEALAEFGSDKPDLRNPLRIKDVSSVFKDSEFAVFKDALADGGVVLAISVADVPVPSRKFFDQISTEFKQKSDGLALAYLAKQQGEWKGSIAKFCNDSAYGQLLGRAPVGDSGVVFFVAGTTERIRPWMGRLRTQLGEHFDLIEKDVFRFCWITDYPLYERDAETGKLDFSHNPFGIPRGGLDALNSSDPLEIYSDQYDLVCNGYELGSGAIRNARPEVMYKAFELVGYSKEVVDERFGGMIRAFSYGTPPHGGFAHGLDRIIMLLCGESAIRDVIPFPMAQTKEDLMMGAPAPATPEQLKELHIKLA